MKTVKGEVAKFMIAKGGNPSIRDWRQFIASTNHPVRVKEVGSKGKVNLNFSGNDGWIGQADWLFNYQQECIRRFISERERLEEILPQEQLSKLFYSADASKQLTDFEQWLLQFFRDMMDSASLGNLQPWVLLDSILTRFRENAKVAIPKDWIHQCWQENKRHTK